MAGVLVRMRGYLLGLVIAGLLIPAPGLAERTQVAVGSPPSSGPLPLDVRAERIDYLQNQEVYEADGTVVVDQGTLHLTADHIIIQALPGVLIATGHVHLTDPKADLVTDRLELNVNTEAGVVTNGQLHVPASNSFVTGRLLQRFSEDHYRVKEGTFTNCDAQQGEVPAWRFQFKDLDLEAGDHVAFTGTWLCVMDVPLVPIPTMTYPLSNRRSGFLIPQILYDNRFGFNAQGSYYWAINPSQDLTLAPYYYSKLGYGSEASYRYMLDRQSKGQWYVNLLQQTQLPNVSGVDQQGGGATQTRAVITGSHTQQFNPDLLLRLQANFVTDPNVLQQLSNSGVQRALPSLESNLLANQRFTTGNLYLWSNYLQPLEQGGVDTFQRLPEIGYSLPYLSLLNSPLLFGGETSAVNFYRTEGFQQNRLDLVPGLSTDVIDFGHMVGLTPQVKFREVYYTRGVDTVQSQHRETFWAALDAASKLSRQFGASEGGSFLHTIEPSVIYEYVPPTDQSQITQIDQVDNLPKKNLLTYSLRNRVLEQDGGSSFNWLDLTLAQSYHVGGIQTQATNFTPGVQPLVGTITQPLQPATVSVDGKKLSDLWMRAVIGNTSPQYTQAQLAGTALTRGGGPAPGQRPPINQYLVLDGFLSPYTGSFTQWNTDLRVQQSNDWYLEVGQRFTNGGNRVQRGDLWNPISFNQVFAPTGEVEFLTTGGAFRTPWGWTIGAKAYYNIQTGTVPELDIVGLYQNPCKCWSLGIYYLQFPDRQQYNFMLNLTGIGWTENFGTNVLRSILSPLLIGEKGLPWAAPGGPYGFPLSSIPPQSGVVGR
ncbi:MAG TPA: LPS assembly protein LptD [Nitrospiraceae bacterium]|nr:LPS assembly protein LptD [Nitrospiraceae bacterium]